MGSCAADMGCYSMGVTGARSVAIPRSPWPAPSAHLHLICTKPAERRLLDALVGQVVPPPPHCGLRCNTEPATSVIPPSRLA